MAKDKTNYSGELNETNFQSSDSKTVTIQFRENRKFDLHIGRNMITFYGRESKPVPESWINHPDFQNVRNYFLIKGV